MEYNNEKTVNEIKKLLSMIEYDAQNMNDSSREEERIRLEATYEELECMWRTLEIVGNYVERAKTLIDKMLDEREDMEAEDEGE